MTSQPVTTGAKVTHYCAAFWALYDDLNKQAAAGDIDEYGVSYRLRDHLLACGECRAATNGNLQGEKESRER